MGLDMNVAAKPREGFEEEFNLLWVQYWTASGAMPDPELQKKSFLGRLLHRAPQVDTEQIAARIGEISVPAYASIGAPVVGVDEAASLWVRQQFEAGHLAFPTLEAALSEMQGYHSVEALPPGDAFPLYSNGGLYEGADRTSFRGQFLEDCVPVIGKPLLKQAWNPMLAHEFRDWGSEMQQAAARFASSEGVTEILSPDSALPQEDATEAERMAHIVGSAARWALWWSQRGHGMEPFF